MMNLSEIEHNCNYRFRDIMLGLSGDPYFGIRLVPRPLGAAKIEGEGLPIGFWEWPSARRDAWCEANPGVLNPAAKPERKARTEMGNGKTEPFETAEMRARAGYEAAGHGFAAQAENGNRVV